LDYLLGVISGQDDEIFGFPVQCMEKLFFEPVLEKLVFEAVLEDSK